MAQLELPLVGQVRDWMRRELDGDEETYVDCGEPQRTQLGEAAAAHFTLYADDSDATIPDWVWDVAHEVCAAWEDAHEVDQGYLDAREVEEDCDGEGLAFGDGSVAWGA